LFATPLEILLLAYKAISNRFRNINYQLVGSWGIGEDGCSARQPFAFGLTPIKGSNDLRPPRPLTRDLFGSIKSDNFHSHIGRNTGGGHLEDFYYLILPDLC